MLHRGPYEIRTSIQKHLAQLLLEGGPYKYFSHTRSEFPLFLPILSHIPVQDRGNDKKNIIDVNVMLKLRHHVASQRIQDFLDVFSGFSIIK